MGKVNEIDNPEDVKVYGKLISRRTSLPKLNKNQFYFNDLIKLKVFVSEKNWAGKCCQKSWSWRLS